MTREETLRRVEMLDFALADVNIFLNNHPNDTAALNFYNQDNQLHKQAVAQFEESFGPMTASGVNIEDGWSWIDKPWPWEMEG